MTSQPNIPFAEIRRLLIDDTAPVDFRFWSAEAAINLTGKLFRIVIYPAGQTTAALTLEDGAIDRPDGASAGLLRWNADANRTELSSTAPYTGYLFELIDGKREPRAWFRYQWLTEPSAYVEGLPVEPPEFKLSYGGMPVAGAGVSVYGVGQPGFADADDARAAALPLGLPLFVIVDGYPAFKNENGVFMLPISPA